MNLSPGGTAALVAMRRDLLTHLRAEPGLRLLDADLRHLLASWFNRGFLELRRIDWQTPAAILEKLITYEAVHEIQGWEDLRRRLAPDRRCFAFFHPGLPGDPLIFVEVALTEGLATSVQPLLAREGDESAERERAARADTAIFYSISNCQDGLRGISFGNFLIKQVVEELKAELPRLRRFSTLSPVPGPAPLGGEAGGRGPAAKRGRADAVPPDEARDSLLRLCARYLTTGATAGPRSTRSRASTSATAPGSSASTGAATPPRAACASPTGSWSTTSTIPTRSRPTTRPSSTAPWSAPARSTPYCAHRTRRQPRPARARADPPRRHLTKPEPGHDTSGTKHGGQRPTPLLERKRMSFGAASGIGPIPPARTRTPLNRQQISGSGPPGSAGCWTAWIP